MNKFKLFIIIFAYIVYPLEGFSGGRYDGLIKNLDNFMGDGATVVRNDARGFVAESNNGNKFRMDHDGHGYKPHAHLETPRPNGNMRDASGTPHHIYFKD